MTNVPPNSVACIYNAVVNLRTSSNTDVAHSQLHCLLNYKNPKNNSSEGWKPLYNDTNQYIAGCGEKTKTFVALATQGSGNSSTWVKSYKIKYSVDNITWVDYNNGQVFNANNDQNSIVVLVFDTPIVARSIAIHPQSWNGDICMRLEIYTKPLVHTFTQGGTVETTAGNIGSGSGMRENSIAVTFDRPFRVIPKVGISFTLIDSTAKGGQTRIGVDARNITTTGFNAVFYTWIDNQVYSLKADYIAVETL